MGWLEFNRNIKSWRSQMIIPLVCKGVWGWFEDSCDLAGIKKSEAITWTEPRREAIDVTKEAEAEKAEMRMGKKSLSEVILENGRDPEKVFALIKKEREQFKNWGLVFDSDASIDAKNAQTAIKTKSEDANA
jgi:capsid protein